MLPRRRRRRPQLLLLTSVRLLLLLRVRLLLLLLAPLLRECGENWLLLLRARLRLIPGRCAMLLLETLGVPPLLRVRLRKLRLLRPWARVTWNKFFRGPVPLCLFCPRYSAGVTRRGKRGGESR